MADQPEIVATKELKSGLTAKIVKSRKSAIPKGIPGSHYIAGIFKEDGSEVDAADVPIEVDMEVYGFLKEFLAQQPGIYRIGQNGPGVGTGLNYHLHGLTCEWDRVGLEQQGWDILRLIDPASFIVPAESAT